MHESSGLAPTNGLNWKERERSIVLQDIGMYGMYGMYVMHGM